MKDKKKAARVAMVNLGCARNLVDAQVILSEYQSKGYEIVEDVSKAGTVIVNTCGFIEDAKKESLDVILDLIELKTKNKIQKVIVRGCLSERYLDILKDEFTDIDEIRGILSIEKEGTLSSVSLTPPHFAYLKICESCYHHCSFCVIPKIKGRFRSRRMSSLLKQVQAMDARGVKELNIIGQDITAYGMDLYGTKKLVELLKKMIPLCHNLEWIRLLYLFPSHVTDELIDLIAQEQKLCKYIDIPLQHINDRLLKKMNRNMSKRKTIALIEKIRKAMPQVALRTSFIVGFPSETEKEFEELVDFVKEVKFEKLGCFMYSQEEDTPAYAMKNQIPQKVKRERFDALMHVQQKISLELQGRFIGTRLKVLVDDHVPKGETLGHLQRERGSLERIYIGRSQYDAPDVDGSVYVYSDKKLKSGKFVDIKVTSSYAYDLAGESV